MDRLTMEYLFYSFLCFSAISQKALTGLDRLNQLRYMDLGLGLRPSFFL